ncbi:uncharacterized protein [Littorina saxatilis]|uniref:Uncharacterized protein n=1 Tax=Littorina saxatilis TaxID=31220 RepID=A0AAN9BMQ9_9CAEN
MATGAEGIILQPLWKIHNIDWSDRRNVFETDPSRPSLDLLRRNTITLSRYDVTTYQSNSAHFDNIDSHGDHGKLLFSKWSRYSAHSFHTTTCHQAPMPALH